MKIGVISQPWARVLPPSESLAIWTNEVGRRLRERAEVMVLSRGSGPVPRDGVHYLPVDSEADWRELRVLAAAARFRPRRRPVFASGLYNRRYFGRAARMAVEHGCDVVHLMNFAQPARAVKRADPQSRVALHMHCDWLSQLSPRLMRSRAEHVDLVVGCSRYVTGRAQAVLPDVRCETLHNGVDVEAFHPGREAPVPTNPRVLFVGRVSPDKGVHVLIEALASLSSVYPEIELQLVGDEALPPLEMQVAIDTEERVRALARFYGQDGFLPTLLASLPDGVSEKVTHTPWVGRDALPGLYRSSTMLVLPSVWEEPFGIPLVEAMASGLPVVATRVGGIPEIVEDGVTGLLVPPADAEALSDAIRQLLADPARAHAMGAAGRDRVEQHFSWEAVTAKLSGLYGEL